MIPMMIRISVTDKRGKRFRFTFPIILVWLLLFFILLLFAPLMILISLLIWPSGYGRLLLMFPVRLFDTIAAMCDLLIDIKSKKENIYISFY